MSVLDLFSAAPGVRAASSAANALTANLGKGFNYATGALNTGVNRGIGALTNYGGQAIDTLGEYGDKALEGLTGGQGKQIAAYMAGNVPFQQLFGQYAPGAATYWHNLGVPDPGGNVAGGGGSFGGGGASEGWDGPTWGGSPVGDYQHSPGYDETYRQGIEAAARTGQSTGQYGAANMDAMNFAHTLSDRDFNQYLQNLLPAISGQQTAATGIQRGFGEVGDAYGQGGRDIADLLSKTGTSIANIQGGEGAGISGLESNLGAKLAGYGSDYYNAKGQTAANKYAQQFGARTAANQNTLDALFKVAQLGVSAATGGMGGGLGSLFGGNGNFYDQPGSGTMTNMGDVGYPDVQYWDTGGG